MEFHALKEDKEIWEWTKHWNGYIMNSCLTVFSIPQGALRCYKDGSYCVADMMIVKKNICCDSSFSDPSLYEPKTTLSDDQKFKYKVGTTIDKETKDWFGIGFYPDQKPNEYLRSSVDYDQHRYLRYRYPFEGKMLMNHNKNL